MGFKVAHNLCKDAQEPSGKTTEGHVGKKKTVSSQMPWASRAHSPLPYPFCPSSLIFAVDGVGTKPDNF